MNDPPTSVPEAAPRPAPAPAVPDKATGNAPDTLGATSEPPELSVRRNKPRLCGRTDPTWSGVPTCLKCARMCAVLCAWAVAGTASAWLGRRGGWHAKRDRGRGRCRARGRGRAPGPVAWLPLALIGCCRTCCCGTCDGCGICNGARCECSGGSDGDVRRPGAPPFGAECATACATAPPRASRVVAAELMLGRASRPAGAVANAVCCRGAGSGGRVWPPVVLCSTRARFGARRTRSSSLSSSAPSRGRLNKAAVLLHRDVMPFHEKTLIAGGAPRAASSA